MTQRWNHGRDSYRPAGEPIDPSRYGVEVLPEVAAIPYWTGTSSGVELGRFVLLDDVPANGETWFLARAFRALESELPDLRAVLSYSDPMARHRADGTLVTPGHVGTIYQAHNGRHVGRGRAETLYLDRDARTVSRRSLSKLRNGESGADGVYRSLIERGAPARNSGEAMDAYVDRAMREGPFRKVKHPGNLAYLWPIGASRSATEAAFKPRLPNPKRDTDPRASQLCLLGGRMTTFEFCNAADVDGWSCERKKGHDDLHACGIVDESKIPKLHAAAGNRGIPWPEAADRVWQGTVPWRERENLVLAALGSLPPGQDAVACLVEDLGMRPGNVRRILANLRKQGLIP